MLSTKAEIVRWIPETDSDRERVQQELSSILSSAHFRNSRRYPALLRYIVERTLDGEGDCLKERTLGVEVFERRPDYDTSADPVVRFSASEVRKRLAQHYHEAQEEAELQIELPLGSYVPEFRLRIDAAEARRLDRPDKVIAEPMSAFEVLAGAQEMDEPVKTMPVRWRRIAVRCGVAMLLAMCLGWAVHRAMYPDLTKVFWRPVLASSSPVLIVVGAGNLELTTPEAPQTSLYEHMIGPYHHVSLSTALAISGLTNVLELNHAGYVVKEARDTSLTDLRGRSVILVGALNNIWTLRLAAPLRYRFLSGPLAQIEDRQRPGRGQWMVDLSKPFVNVLTDYAIVARYHDDSTNGEVMIVGGLGPYGTEAAGELVASPQYLERILKQLPASWRSRNIELVIKTDVIDGQAGPPNLVDAATW
jgi:hypothetical protein